MTATRDSFGGTIARIDEHLGKSRFGDQFSIEGAESRLKDEERIKSERESLLKRELINMIDKIIIGNIDNQDDYTDEQLFSITKKIFDKLFYDYEVVKIAKRVFNLSDFSVSEEAQGEAKFNLHVIIDKEVEKELEISK